MAATKKIWFYDVRNDGYDPEKILGGGRPETAEMNDIPGLLDAWTEFKATRFEQPPGAQAGVVLEVGSDEPRAWWASFETVAENDWNLAASRYKPAIAESAPEGDPAELVREVLALEERITEGLESLLKEVDEG